MRPRVSGWAGAEAIVGVAHVNAVAFAVGAEHAEVVHEVADAGMVRTASSMLLLRNEVGRLIASGLLVAMVGWAVHAPPGRRYAAW